MQQGKKKATNKSVTYAHTSQVYASKFGHQCLYDRNSCLGDLDAGWNLFHIQTMAGQVVVYFS